MALPTFTYSGVSYAAQPAGTTTFALTTSGGKAINYLLPSHIHVYSTVDNGATLVELTRPAQWGFNPAGTSVVLTSGIAAGTAIILRRVTSSDGPYTTFGQGTLLTADQLNDATLFNLYTSQETEDEAGSATAAALLATTTAATATANANAATSTANTALSTANAAVSTANAATATANTASTNASAAVSTANTASTNASAAVSTANTASANASTAVTTANTASANASTALANSSTAITTANSANATAQAASTTATNAQSVANSALTLVTGVVNFQPIANVAAIPASPSNDDAVQVVDSTGIQSFTPLTGLPAGFVGTPQLFVRLQYNGPGSTWEYAGYGANDPDKRYVVQGVLGTAASPSFYFDADTGIFSSGANELGLSTGGNARLTIDSSGAVAIPGSLSVTGAVTTTGTSTAASFIPTSSTAPSNGVYLPAANSVAISTNGTGRLFVDASGKVSIGVATFSKTFNVIAADASINLRANSGGTYTDHGIFFAVDGVNYSQIYNDGVGQLIFRTGSGLAERMRLTSDGRLGLGLSSPFTTIHSAKSVTGGSPATSGTTDANVIARFQGGSVGFDLGATASGPQWIQPRNVNDLSVNYGLSLCPNGGNVAIGATGPLSALHVQSAAGTEQIRWTDNTNGTGLLDTASGASRIYSNVALAFGTGSASFSEKARITTDGRLGLGTSAPAVNLHVVSPNDTTISSVSTGTIQSARVQIVGRQSSADEEWNIVAAGSGLGSAALRFVRGGWTGTPSMLIDSSGRVGIGTTSPGEQLSIAGGANLYTTLTSTGGIKTALAAADANGFGWVGTTTNHALALFTNNTERVRIDNSGRLLVGTSTSLNTKYNTSSFQPGLQSAATAGTAGFYRFSNNADGPALVLSKSRSDTLGTQAIVSNGDTIGYLGFTGSDGTEFQTGATIIAQVDGTPGTNDMPGRLVFSTTADGASSPTERMRINSSGDVFIGQSTSNAPGVGNTTEGAAIQSRGIGCFSNSGAIPFYINRSANDGTLVSLRQDGTEEGTISVSGTTVSYNGAHLSRWSQLPGGATREEILRGTVLSNIDEMCGWGEEDNEQLNRMQVSNVEGDPNVSGVFQAWDDDDDTYTDDFYCAMTGDFIIRIAEGVTVQRGDLLMSAGDGTAKPQDDDIIRSKTVAKVTSTHVTCTYDDGSYCVPCVLMAC